VVISFSFDVTEVRAATSVSVNATVEQKPEQRYRHLARRRWSRRADGCAPCPSRARSRNRRTAHEPACTVQVARRAPAR
jgi:hypothetical protein